MPVFTNVTWTCYFWKFVCKTCCHNYLNSVTTVYWYATLEHQYENNINCFLKELNVCEYWIYILAFYLKLFVASFDSIHLSYIKWGLKLLPGNFSNCWNSVFDLTCQLWMTFRLQGCSCTYLTFSAKINQSTVAV